MLMGNRTVTVINRWQQAGQNVYSCHRMGGCSWYTQANRAADAPGQKPVTVHRIRIPADLNLANYADPTTWAVMSPDQRLGAWTLGHDALLVLGDVDCTTDEEYLALCRSGSSARNLSWHDNTRGATPHIYVEGS